MGQLEKYKDQFILLLEAGFIAVNQADEDAAVKLFKAAEMLQPTNALCKVGMGYLHLCKLELKQSCKCFEEILAKEPNHEMARTFLGLAMALMPSEIEKGEKILEEEASKGKDPSLKTLAKDSIQFVQKFVKKAPSPAAQAPKKAEKKKEKNKDR